MASPGESAGVLRRVHWIASRMVRCLVLGLLLTACSPERPSTTSALRSSEWYEFEGTWTATGQRQSIPLGDERRASVADYNGTLLLAGPGRPGVGFRAEALTLNDSATGMVGRAVWTDERGDRIFSELKGEAVTSRNRIVGTFIGGTGRYAGATGTYEFAWRFLIETEGGTVQGQSLDLKGRVRVGMSPDGEDSGAKRP